MARAGLGGVLALAGVALCLALAGAAAAQQVDCALATTQTEMTFCAEQDWQIADAALNTAYAAAVDAMKAVDAGLPKAKRGALDQLRSAQRAWVVFRDAACAAEGYAMHGGSAEPMVIYACRARLTDERRVGLEALVAER